MMKLLGLLICAHAVVFAGGVATAAPKVTPAASKSSKPQGLGYAAALKGPSAGQRLGAKPKLTLKASDSAAPSRLGTEADPLKLELDLHAADSVVNPTERRQAIAKVKGVIAARDAKLPGIGWEATRRAGYVGAVAHYSARVAKARKPLASTAAWLAVSALTSVISLAVGHEVVDVGQAASSDIATTIVKLSGYGSVVMTAIFGIDYANARTALRQAVEASARAFTNFITFEKLIERTASRRP